MYSMSQFMGHCHCIINRICEVQHDVSENIDDKQYQRAIDYAQKFGEAFKLYRLSLDSNDDGIEDKEEKTALRSMRMYKR